MKVNNILTRQSWNKLELSQSVQFFSCLASYVVKIRPIEFSNSEILTGNYWRWCGFGFGFETVDPQEKETGNPRLKRGSGWEECGFRVYYLEGENWNRNGVSFTRVMRMLCWYRQKMQEVALCIIAYLVLASVCTLTD